MTASKIIRLNIIARRVANMYLTGRTVLRHPRGRKRIAQARRMFCVVALLDPDIRLADLAQYLYLAPTKIRDLIQAGSQEYEAIPTFRARVDLLVKKHPHLAAA